MLNEFENKVCDFIQSHRLLECNAVLAAVSGGADSVAMLICLTRIISNFRGGLRIVIGHVNHHLRGAASDGDEHFVSKLAAAFGLECCTRSVDVKQHARAEHLSIETAARLLRVNELIDMAAQARCDAIATAHHMNDNAETLVHRLLRGTGLRGLAGIRPARTLKGDAGCTTFISPLLSAKRDEILAYCTVNGIAWRHDHTNDDFAHTRNRIRHVLLPSIQSDASSDMVRLLHHLSQACQNLLTQIEQRAAILHSAAIKENSRRRVILDRFTLTSQPEAVVVELIRRTLMELGIGLRNMSEARYRALVQQAFSGCPRRLSLPNGLTASVNGSNLSFETTPPAVDTGPTDAQILTIPGRTPFGGVEFDTALLNAQTCDIEAFKAAKNPHTEWFDYDKLSLPLYVRTRRQGDRFQPLGMPAEKKIGKFLSAAVDAEAREQMFIVGDAEKIIWVAPVRCCEQTKVTADTTTILQIALKSPRVGCSPQHQYRTSI